MAISAIFCRSMAKGIKMIGKSSANAPNQNAGPTIVNASLMAESVTVSASAYSAIIYSLQQSTPKRTVQKKAVSALAPSALKIIASASKKARNVLKSAVVSTAKIKKVDISCFNLCK